MPRVNLPEQMRKKAMRSRCAGFILAWILKTKAGKILFLGCDKTGHRLPRAWRRGHLDKTVEQFADAEIVDGAAKKDRGLAGLQVMFVLKRIGGAVEQLDVLTQVTCCLFAEQIGQPADRSGLR